jgi:hypothetical protein
MKNKMSLEQISTILANEADLLHCTLEEAWEGISTEITSQFNFEDVKSFIMELEQ